MKCYATPTTVKEGLKHTPFEEGGLIVRTKCTHYVLTYIRTYIYIKLILLFPGSMHYLIKAMVKLADVFST